MRTFYILLVVAGLASAQLEDQTITVTAIGTPAVASKMDQIFVTIVVTAPLSASLDEVLKAVSAAGVTEQNLTEVSAPRGEQRCPTPPVFCIPSPAMVQWTFSFIAPLSKSADVLGTLQRLNGQTSPEMPVSVWVRGSGPAATAAAPECAYSALISQARRQAETLAAAAGARAGAVLAMSDGPSYGSAIGTAASAPAAVVRVGDFSSAWFSSNLLTTPTYVQTCSAVVQFKLLR